MNWIEKHRIGLWFLAIIIVAATLIIEMATVIINYFPLFILFPIALAIGLIIVFYLKVKSIKKQSNIKS